MPPTLVPVHTVSAGTPHTSHHWSADLSPGSVRLGPVLVGTFACHPSLLGWLGILACSAGWHFRVPHSAASHSSTLPTTPCHSLALSFQYITARPFCSTYLPKPTIFITPACQLQPPVLPFFGDHSVYPLHGCLHHQWMPFILGLVPTKVNPNKPV